FRIKKAGVVSKVFSRIEKGAVYDVRQFGHRNERATPLGIQPLGRNLIELFVVRNHKVFGYSAAECPITPRSEIETGTISFELLLLHIRFEKSQHTIVNH